MRQDKCTHPTPKMTNGRISVIFENGTPEHKLVVQGGAKQDMEEIYMQHVSYTHHDKIRSDRHRVERNHNVPTIKTKP